MRVWMFYSTAIILQTNVTIGKQGCKIVDGPQLENSIRLTGKRPDNTKENTKKQKTHRLTNRYFFTHTDKMLF